MIYFDNAATSWPKPACVAEAVTHSIANFGNASRGAHTLSVNANRAVLETREQISSLFNVGSPLRVVFTSNATESLNTAIFGCLSPEDHIISTVFEHNSVIRPLRMLGSAVDYVPCHQNMQFNYADLERLITAKTKAIICTHSSNLTGDMIDIRKIGEICNRHHLLFILDAAQTAGVFDIDMQENHISILCFTGHKSLFSLQGVGGLCLAPDICIRPLKVGGTGSHTFDAAPPPSLPDALEAGTLNGHGIASLSAGLSYIQQVGLPAIRTHAQSLARAFYERIQLIKPVKIYGNFETGHRAPIVALNIGSVDSATISDLLCEKYDIAVRAGAHCAPLMHEFLGTNNQGALRFSFSSFNTLQEVELAARALTAIVSDYRI